MRGILVDMIKALLLLSVLVVVWWLASVFITPFWDALLPFISSYTNDFATQSVSTLGLVKTIWNNLPFLFALAIFVWFYLRAQRREPDTYYMQ